MLNYGQLFHQYFVDMYAKIESERLLYIRPNQTNLRVEEYSTLVDRCLNEEEATNYPVEFLNSVNPNDIPQHTLVLKVGCPIMLLRNMKPPRMCNWTRLVVIELQKYIIKVTILTRPFEGDDVLIPRIPLTPNDLPFAFRRLQFSVSMAFAMTINKAQGQSLNVTCSDLTDECFSHGQLYVGMARAKILKKQI